MGIRSLINEHPRASAEIGGALLLIFIVAIVSQLGGSRHSRNEGKAFFSDDDGKTWFLDDELKLPPFDHNGRQAYRAALFRCGSGKPFVAYLERYSDAQLKLLNAQRPGPLPSAAPAPPAGPPPMPEYAKRHGAPKWASALSSQGNDGDNTYDKITTPTCPEGSTGQITVVFPSDI